MNKNGTKDFDRWIKVKKKIDKDNVTRSVKEGEIWWSSIGENVGTEICGKGDASMRPVLIFRKIDKNSFWAIPLTSKRHLGSWYAPFTFNGRVQTAIVSQIQNMSTARLKRKMGQIPNSDYAAIYSTFLKLAKNTP